MNGEPDTIEVRRVALMVNPAAGRHRAGRIARLAERLAATGLEVETVISAGPGDLARRLPGIRADVVAVAGGDGTIDEVVGALVGLTGRRPALAVVPAGTANVLAQEYRLPRRADAIVATIAAGRTRPLHLGTATFADGTARPFFLMTSAGFDAEVVHEVESRSGRRFKKLAFVGAALGRVFTPRNDVMVEATTTSGERIAVRAALAVVTKARHYGGPFVITRRTSADVAGLRLVAVVEGHPAALARAALDLAAGRLEEASGVLSQEVAMVRLTAVSGAPVAVQIDGEACGHTPVEIRAERTVLDLVVPA
ncbi:MAG: diacylglycerol kinase family protein [Siculibacillus sp.]|nr:diacylglycerol kinase family protein [Siculibacillus sp.]